MSNSPTIAKQLLDRIANQDVRGKVSLIIDLCVGAVGNLDTLDHEIYKRTQAAIEKHGVGLHSKQDLEELAATVLQEVRGLASYLMNTDLGVDEEAVEDDPGIDFDFDLGGAQERPQEVTLDDDDIASALDGLAPTNRQSGDERWAALSAELASFAYALSTQLEDFDQRFASALEQKRIPQALRELDDVGNALIDGVFALMSAIFETYLDSFDRDQMLPGHRDTLGKALLVRRGIADLRRVIKRANACVQDAKAPDEMRQAGVDTMAEELFGFINGEVFRVMRPADRLELQNFYEEIAGNTAKQAALSCEGFDKYLDSLLAVNQRDVLIRHDRELMGEIAATLEGVGPILSISPHGAMEMVREAFVKAHALYGYHDRLDGLLAEWDDKVAHTTKPEVMAEIGKRLAAMAQAAIK